MIDVADRLAGEAVGDELLEVVADLDPTRRSSTATTISRPLSLPFSPMPLPPFSNILTAYSSMSAKGWNVGTVATTTTSPLAACSARMRRSSSRSLSASMTLAKSLTGAVRLGGGACACADAHREQAEPGSHQPQSDVLCTAVAHQARARQVSTYSQIRSDAAM